jgi:hypothetical protein
MPFHALSRPWRARAGQDEGAVWPEGAYGGSARRTGGPASSATALKGNLACSLHGSSWLRHGCTQSSFSCMNGGSGNRHPGAARLLEQVQHRARGHRVRPQLQVHLRDRVLLLRILARRPARARAPQHRTRRQRPLCLSVGQWTEARVMSRCRERSTTPVLLTCESPSRADRLHSACAEPGHAGGPALAHAIRWRPRPCLPTATRVSARAGASCPYNAAAARRVRSPARLCCALP